MLPQFFSRISRIALLAVIFLPSPAVAGNWERQVYGRLQYDYTRSSGDDSGFDLDRGELRTGRIGLDLKGDHTKLRGELALNNDRDVEITDAYIKQALGTSGWDVRAGQFKAQNSLDEQTSGPIWLAGQYGQLRANRTARADATYAGAYTEAGYVFGGRRTYDHNKFDRPEVYRPITAGGPGALVLAARADWLDMSDSAADGGQLNTFTIAADWFATSHVHAGINLYRAEADLGSTSSGLAPAFAAYRLAGGTSEDVTGTSLRIQFDF